MQEKIHNTKRPSITSRQNINKSEQTRVEISAGGIVFKRTGRGVFFAMLKDSYGKWTFPKGHVKRGERYEVAAAREVGEEMNIKNLKMMKPLGHIDIWFRDRFVFKGQLIHKYIHYYLFEVTDNIRLERPKPMPGGEKIQAVAWVPALEVIGRSNYQDMKHILKKTFEELNLVWVNKKGRTTK